MMFLFGAGAIAVLARRRKKPAQAD